MTLHWSQYTANTSPTLIGRRYLSFPKNLWVVDNLLLDHVELPNGLDLAVHLVQKFAGRVKGIILRLFYY